MMQNNEFSNKCLVSKTYREGTQTAYDCHSVDRIFSYNVK